MTYQQSLQSMDSAHAAVADWIRAQPKLEAKLEGGVRRAIDEVIDGPRTGRWSYDQLEKTEKTYVGTKIEIVVRTELGLERIPPLDTNIAGHPVDIKWSVSGGWMIPTEAVGQLCLLLQGDENTGRFGCGLVRCTPERLRLSHNKDGKTSLSKVGRQDIDWFVDGAPLRQNFLATLPDETRSKIMAGASGQERIRLLFSSVPRVPIPRSAVETVAQQRDPMRRLRKDQVERLGGMRVLSATYGNDVVEALGYERLPKDHFISVLESELTAAGLV